MQLSNLLSKLEAACHVRFFFNKKCDKVEKVPSSSQSRKTQWKFESIETTILQVGQRGNKPNGTKATLTLATMGVALNVAALKSTQHFGCFVPPCEL